MFRALTLGKFFMIHLQHRVGQRPLDQVLPRPAAWSSVAAGGRTRWDVHSGITTAPKDAEAELDLPAHVVAAAVSGTNAND
ncbi:hypothetical protein AV530_015371 [Patagioenas fasciata monilis]|uniref:Uncharacterized protein n=1 Tax=Patagioenas fasciata monilis TaxID=372326 RepID=A0A1V4JH85_PATFA|nr:hypothetical protein AV530_015371 [Patagioenas fasciata monilis]